MLEQSTLLMAVNTMPPTSKYPSMPGCRMDVIAKPAAHAGQCKHFYMQAYAKDWRSVNTQPSTCKGQVMGQVSYWKGVAGHAHCLHG